MPLAYASQEFHICLIPKNHSIECFKLLGFKVSLAVLCQNIGMPCYPWRIGDIAVGFLFIVHFSLFISLITAKSWQKDARSRL